MRWMPPEAIDRRRWSEKSDVWAFGVTLWEILSDAMMPFRFVGSDELVAQRVCSGERLTQPDGSPPALYALLQLCCDHVLYPYMVT